MPASCHSWQVASGISAGFMAAAPTYQSACTTGADDLKSSDFRLLPPQEAVGWGISALSLCVQPHPQPQPTLDFSSCYARYQQCTEEQHTRSGDASHWPIIVPESSSPSDCPLLITKDKTSGKLSLKDYKGLWTMSTRQGVPDLSGKMNYDDDEAAERCQEPLGLDGETMLKQMTVGELYEPSIKVGISEVLHLSQCPAPECASENMIRSNAATKDFLTSAEGRSAAHFVSETIALPTAKACSSSSTADALHHIVVTSHGYDVSSERFLTKGCPAASKAVRSSTPVLSEYLPHGYCKPMAGSVVKLSTSPTHCNGVSISDVKSESLHVKEDFANIFFVDLKKLETATTFNVMPIMSTHLTSMNQENAVKGHPCNSLFVVQEDQAWGCVLPQESDTETRVSSSTLSSLSMENENSSSYADIEVQSPYNGRMEDMESSSSLRSTSTPR